MKLFVFLTLIALAAAGPITMELNMDALANPTHYGNPSTGCESDEVQVQVQGVSGQMCAPSCSLFKKCPTDVPDGVSAKPQCALQDSATNKKYCALLCSPGSDGGACGAGSCQAISGVGICTYGNSTTPTTVGVSAEHNAEWAAWKEDFEKEYETAEEEAKRFGIWAENKLLVAEHNAAEVGWTMAMNKFADQTTEEFNSWALGIKTPPGYTSKSQPFVHEVSLRGSNDLPTSVDWRSKGNVVNPVKNQQQCGSCWAFSTIASLETQYAIKNKNLTSFSEQDLVDCVKDVQGCCDGCQGGLMDAAFTYLVTKQSGNDDTESAYPYTQTNGKCKFTENGPAFGGIKSHTTIKQGDESGLQTAVANVGVISIGVDASKGWQMYSKGVYTPGPFGIFTCSNSPNKMDHGVAVVGYNTDSGKDYWIVRNSWGPTWGNEGYMYLIRGKNACGIANSAAYPVLG